MDWFHIAQIVANLALPILGGWFVKKFKTPSDLERAALLEKIAEAAASLVVSLNPKADRATLLQSVIQQISSASGLPTQNQAAITRAATLALSKAGAVPAK